MAPDPANFLISSLKKNPAENYMAPDPANFLISSLKKNLLENRMAPDPTNFLHQLPQKESGKKLCGSRSRQLSSSAPSKRIWWKIIWLQILPTFCISSLKKNLVENYMAPDPANFVHQLPQKESGEKLYGSRSRQLSSSAPSKKIWQKSF